MKDRWRTCFRPPICLLFVTLLPLFCFMQRFWVVSLLRAFQFEREIYSPMSELTLRASAAISASRDSSLAVQ
jgi:hypothetical protein